MNITKKGGNMKRSVLSVVGIFVVVLAVGLCTGAGNAYADSFQINDGYWGGDDHGYGDRIGSSAFEVEWMDITINGGIMTVDIKTNYRGNDNDGFSNLTTDFGDFFISTDGWNPDTSESFYLNDDHTTGEDWEYAFDVSTGNLYAVTGNDILLSDDVMPAGGWTFRNGQEFGIDGSSNLASLSSTANGNTAGSYAGGYYSFQFDISNTDIATASQLGFHWTMSCGNDVIEGGITLPDYGPPSDVPEPATVLLLGSGLTGLAFRRFRKKHI
jgi:hypothetical protein